MKLIATAINHVDMDEDQMLTPEDPFFTPEECKRKYSSLLEMLRIGVADATFPHKEDYEQLASRICQCEAHSSKDRRINELRSH